jgi:predicted nucleotidyltransferase
MIHDLIKYRLSDFNKICQRFNVGHLYAFGSSTTDQFDLSESDIDLLVEIDLSDPIERGENLIKLWDSFENFFNRKVDLLTESSIKNPVLRKNIDQTKILIYDGKGQEVSF